MVAKFSSARRVLKRLPVESHLFQLRRLNAMPDCRSIYNNHICEICTIILARSLPSDKCRQIVQDENLNFWKKNNKKLRCFLARGSAVFLKNFLKNAISELPADLPATNRIISLLLGKIIYKQLRQRVQQCVKIYVHTVFCL